LANVAGAVVAAVAARRSLHGRNDLRNRLFSTVNIDVGAGSRHDQRRRHINTAAEYRGEIESLAIVLDRCPVITPRSLYDVVALQTTGRPGQTRLTVKRRLRLVRLNIYTAIMDNIHTFGTLHHLAEMCQNRNASRNKPGERT
jgi:hypothetical protein